MTPALLATASGSLGALAAGAVAVWRGATVPASQILAPSLAQVRHTSRRIALTFDDGPSEQTPALLELLARYNLRATFFVCGANVERLPHIARAIVDAGHELGNHTYGHIRMCPRLGWQMNLRSPANLLLEMQQAQDTIERHTGVRPRLFRAPYGLRWFGVRNAQRRLDLRGVTWSVIAHDWEWPHDRIAAHLLRHTRPGGIVCLHDGRDIQQSVDIQPLLTALRIVVPAWKKRGLRMTTVTDLLQNHRGQARTRTA